MIGEEKVKMFKHIGITGIAVSLFIFGVAPFTTAGQAEKINATINGIVKNAIKTELEAINSSIQLNTDFRVDEYIKLINKNAKKIISDPTDVKRSDIALCISYLDKIPESRMNAALIADIELIIDWHQQNP